MPITDFRRRGTAKSMKARKAPPFESSRLKDKMHGDRFGLVFKEKGQTLCWRHRIETRHKRLLIGIADILATIKNARNSPIRRCCFEFDSWMRCQRFDHFRLEQYGRSLGPKRTLGNDLGRFCRKSFREGITRTALPRHSPLEVGVVKDASSRCPICFIEQARADHQVDGGIQRLVGNSEAVWPHAHVTHIA